MDILYKIPFFCNITIGGMEEKNKDEWTVGYTSKSRKQRDDLPDKIIGLLRVLIKEIELSGPIRKNWPHFGALTGKNIPSNSYHYHLKDGRPTYVACWCIQDKKIKIVEIYYVGTHKKAPY